MQPLTGEDLHNSVEGNLVIIEPVNEVHSRVTADIHVLDIYFYFTRLPTGATQVIAQRRGRGALSRPNHETARRKSLLSNLDLFE